jgi:hypothetical protein
MGVFALYKEAVGKLSELKFPLPPPIKNMRSKQGLPELRDPHIVAPHPSTLGPRPLRKAPARTLHRQGNGALLLARRQPSSFPLPPFLPVPPPPQYPPLPFVTRHDLAPSPARPAMAPLAPPLRLLLAPAAGAARGRRALRLRGSAIFLLLEFE